MSRRPPPEGWANTHLSRLLGITNVQLGRYLNGLCYPTVPVMQKFEIVLGWPTAEQIVLLPVYWEWPDQPGGGQYSQQGSATDLRYAMKLKQVMGEWCEANPRTQNLKDIGLHPALSTKHHGGGRPRV